MHEYGGNVVSSPPWFPNVSTMCPLKLQERERENGRAHSLHRIFGEIVKKAEIPSLSEENILNTFITQAAARGGRTWISDISSLKDLV